MKAGYESDRWRLLVLDRATGKVTNLTEKWTAGSPASSGRPIPARLFFTSEDRGTAGIQFIPVTGGAIRIAASGDNHLDEMQFTRDGKSMVYTQQNGSSPVEIYRALRRAGSRWRSRI